MIRYIDEHKDRFGVEGICRTLGEQLACGFLTASGYWAGKRRPPAQRTLSDRALTVVIEQQHAANYGVYGVRKMWWLLTRQGHQVGRDRVARLMRAAGLRGVIRGRRAFTTRTDPADQRPADLVQRRFSAPAPNRLWVADLTYVRTWAGFCYVAFVVDVYSRMIVGWAASATMRTEDLPLVALETAAWARVGSLDRLIHHSDRGSQGGFNWSSQHLDDGGAWWVFANGSERFGSIGGRSRRRGGRRSPGARTESGSGRRSLEA
jgi:HTH-like domain/Integrase core domain